MNEDANRALVAALESVVDHHCSGVCDDGWEQPKAYPSHPEWNHAGAMAMDFIQFILRHHIAFADSTNWNDR